jgi:hypothetical protein
MLDRICLHGSLSQDFVATLELAEELIVEVIAIGQEASVQFCTSLNPTSKAQKTLSGRRPGSAQRR